MHIMNVIVVVAIAAAITPSLGKAGGHVLKTIFSSNLAANGVATTPGGRMFLPIQPEKPGEGPEVVEVRDGRATPYPDAAWNNWKPNNDGHGVFVGVNALRVGPDGNLWIVDKGSTGVDEPHVPGGQKVVRIDLKTDKVVRTYELADATTPTTFIDDIRFNGRYAYLTDAGKPGLIVLDLESGKERRVLDGHSSTVAHSKLMAEGRELRDPKNRPTVINADQLEVSPDGRWFYYQPCSGGMSRIETRYLDDPSLSDAKIAKHIEHFADTPSTGGTAIAADGTIYLSDIDHLKILKISPSGDISTLVSDERLTWVDAMWIDDNGNLLMPAAQLNRRAAFNGGVDKVVKPLNIYSMAIRAKPVRR